MKLISRLTKGNVVTASNIKLLTANVCLQSGNFVAFTSSARLHWFNALTTFLSKYAQSPSQSNSTPQTNHKINNLLSISNVIDRVKAVKATHITVSKLNLVHCQFEHVVFLPKTSEER